MDEEVIFGADAAVFLKFGIMLVIGVLLLSAFSDSVPKTGGIALTFTKNPSDGDTVTLDGHTYEFDNDNNTVSGHIPVTIGNTMSATFNNTKAVVSENYGVM